LFTSAIAAFEHAGSVTSERVAAEIIRPLQGAAMAAVAPELYYTTLTAAFTGVIWVPIIINRLTEMGPWKALSNPEPDVRPHANWAYRLAHAHRNAVENLAVFAPLAIIVHMLGLGSPLTAAAAAIFLYARVAHAIIYTLGIPLLRTIAFFIGFLCQMILAARVLGLI
jgi:uncharacterized MAPEG superfamily protein